MIKFHYQYSSDCLVFFVASLSATCEAGWGDKTKPFTSSDEFDPLVKKSVSTNPVHLKEFNWAEEEGQCWLLTKKEMKIERQIRFH